MPSGPTGKDVSEVGEQLRHLRDREEILEQKRGDQDEEDRRRGAQRFDQACRRSSPTAGAARSTPITNAPKTPSPAASVMVTKPP